VWGFIVNDKFWIILCMLYGFGASVLAGYFGVPFEVRVAGFLACVLIVVIGGPLGAIVGYFLAKDADVDTKGFKIIAWSGLIGWLIPVVGATLASMAYMFKRRSTFNEGLYNNLSNIVGLLAITNAMIGGGWAAYDGLAAKQADSSSSGMSGALERRGIEPQEITGERSTDRCKYAALEDWSREDLDRYC